MSACDLCRYWHVSELVRLVGECRRHAPIVTTLTVVTNDNDRTEWDPRAEWPKTRPDGFCGDFKERA